VGGVAAAVILLLLLAGAAWYWLRPSAGGDAPATAGPAPAEPGGPLPSSGDTVPLPALDASDEFVRGLVSRLSSHPQLARWLVTDDLVRRFVGVVVDLAGGSNPSAHIRFMAPAEEFTAERREGRLVMARASQRRYDLMAATFASLDTRGSAQLFRQLRPLIDEAYRELGIPGTGFDEVLAMAVENLLAVPPAEGPLEVVGSEGIFVFADPEIEARRGAEKVLLRMGPENTRRIQEKVRELALELGLPPG
jgi:hypothetical protein